MYYYFKLEQAENKVISFTQLNINDEDIEKYYRSGQQLQLQNVVRMDEPGNFSPVYDLADFLCDNMKLLREKDAANYMNTIENLRVKS